MTTNQSESPGSSHRSAERIDAGRKALVALLRHQGKRAPSSSVEAEIDASDGELSLPADEQAEMPHRFPLLSNFRSRSRHRRGMPSPMTARR